MRGKRTKRASFTEERAIFRAFPALSQRLPWTDLVSSPTPVVPLGLGTEGGEIWIKRDDLSSRLYGGNKPRTLEPLFGEAISAGCERVVSMGAFGSNHALATVVHAPRVGLESGALLFPQPPSAEAMANFDVIRRRVDWLRCLRHWSALPYGVWRLQRESTERGAPYLMPPGGAIPLGALGYVSAALELGEQVNQGLLPVPERIVLPVGSTCTAAGLVLGLFLAGRIRGAFRRRGRARPPWVHAVRVTPWPVTSAWRVLSLASRTSALLAELTGDAGLRVRPSALKRLLYVDGRELGAGYGYETPRGAATRHHPLAERVALDPVYSEKAAAGLLRARPTALREPVLFWATKSAVSGDTETASPGRPHPVPRWVSRKSWRAGLGSVDDIGIR